MLPAPPAPHSTRLDERLWYGAAYYPEQWTPADWERDFARMAQAGMNVVRLAEFAWSALEPEEGRFDFAWLDAALEVAHRHGIAAILGTPTAAPPVWLTKRYPEVLLEKFDGHRATHGGRCHFHWIHPEYRRHARRVAAALAERYGRDARVIGWQLDNELSHASHDALSAAHFRAWLQRRYGTIAELNQRWGLRYWSTELESFDDIGIHFELTTPCYNLAWRRFFTEQWVDYLRDQLEVMRPRVAPAQFITTNFHGLYGYGDPFVIGAGLDVAGLDYYSGRPGYDPAETGWVFDLARGIRRRPFALLEIQPWHQNWAAVNADYPPGLGRTYVWQAIAHGANAVLYWQYRVAAGGIEQYHGALTNAAGLPRPCFAEAARIGEELARLSPLLAGTEARSACAVLYRDLDRWMIDSARHHADFDWSRHLATHYRALQGMGVDVDLIDGAGALDAYRLVVAPHLHLGDPALTERLHAWVAAGGHLVLGARSGVKDAENALLTTACQPGPGFTEALGARIIDHHALVQPIALDGAGPGAEAVYWAEVVDCAPEAGTEVVWRFHQPGGWLAEVPALVTRPVGRGRISYVAFHPNAAAAEALGSWYQSVGSLPADACRLPAAVERRRRQGAAGPLEFWFNHGPEPREVRLAQPAEDLLSGERLPSGPLPLSGYALRVLRPLESYQK